MFVNATFSADGNSDYYMYCCVSKHSTNKSSASSKIARTERPEEDRRGLWRSGGTAAEVLPDERTRAVEHYLRSEKEHYFTW